MKRRLTRIAYERRMDVLEMVYHAQAGHLGGDMSCMEILVSLYYEVMDMHKLLAESWDRDRFVFSKGHNAEALYAVLADCGFFQKEKLREYTCFDSPLAQHPTRKVPGVEVATGSLGHGLSVGVGMALGFVRSKNPAHVYVLMGDGEQAEGSIWEAAMAASKYDLENLTAIVDRNALQISGETEKVMPLEDLEKKYRAFGWEVVVCNGHNCDEIIKALYTRMSKKPVAVIAKTHKGYGSRTTVDKAQWHHKVPSQQEYEQIRNELAEKIKKGDEMW